METEEVVQLMHEGYHSVETIAKWANVPVSYVNYLYQKHLAERRTIEECQGQLS
jgi:hypothetical protein